MMPRRMLRDTSSDVSISMATRGIIACAYYTKKVREYDVLKKIVPFLFRIVPSSWMCGTILTTSLMVVAYKT